MRLFATVTICALLFCLLAVPPAHAWGTRSMQAIARASMSVLPVELQKSMRAHESEIFAGATLSEDKLLERFPQYGFADTVLTVTAEMELLRSARKRGITPYFGFRMGILGQRVAAMSQPFYSAPESADIKRWENRYEADAERYTTASIRYQAAERKHMLDVRTYFETREDFLSDSEELIASDYKAGLGFDEYAKRTLPVHFTNAVNGVADTWFTVFEDEPLSAAATGRGSSLTDYYVDAIGFYLARGDDVQAGAAQTFLDDAGVLEEETLKKVADQYYDNGRQEQAMTFYRTVLEESPRRTDVRRRISDYFFAKGLDLLDKKQYSEAEAAFDEVINNDISRGDARDKKQEAAKLLRERQERLELAQKSVRQARKAIADAARAEEQRNFAEALALYRQAAEEYARISEEFGEQYSEASRATSRIEKNVARLIGELVDEIVALQPIAVREQAQNVILNNSKEELATLATRLVMDSHGAEVRALRARLIAEEKQALRE